MEDSKNIGRYFPNDQSSSFLYTGTTFAILSLSGNILVHSDWLIIMFNGRDITFSIHFNNFVEILS